MTEFDPSIPGERDFPAGRLEQRRAHLVREARGARRRRISRRGLLLVPVGAILIAGGAWAAGLFSGGVKHPEIVQCYAAPSLKAEHTPAFTDAPGITVGEATPQELCAPFFERGFLSAAGPPPNLVACSGDRGVSVFPTDSPDLCSRLGLRYMRADAYKSDIQHVRKAFQIARTVIAHEIGQDIDFDDDGKGYTLVSGTGCLRPQLAVRLVKAAIEKAGLDDEFAVRLHKDIGERDCIEYAGAASSSDPHTIELQTEEIAFRGMHEPTPAEDRAGRERTKHQCDHPLGRAGAQMAEDIHDVIICAIDRGDDCVRPQALKALVERALRREELSGWKVKVVDRHPRSGRRYVNSRLTDSRIREVVIVLGGKCPAF